MKKDILKSVMLALCMLVSFYANAQVFELDGIYYYITSESEKEVIVTYKGDGSKPCYTGDIVIPEKAGLYSVVGIGSYAFENCKELTSIKIPNSITRIWKSAFSGCTGLTSITIPNSVTSIGLYSFAGCDGLTSITIPNSVKSIEEEAFLNCNGLTSITIPNSVTSIGEDAFQNCN